MFEILENGRPTGMTYKGRKGWRQAVALTRELSAIFGGRHTTFYVARVG